MRFMLCLLLALVACSASADTNIYARRVNISSAQIDADEMARTGILRHCGRSGGRREGIGFSIVDIEQEPDAAFTVEQANGGNQTVPTLLFSDGSTLTNPSVAQVKDKLAALA